MSLDSLWKPDFPTERTLNEWCRREILTRSKGPSEMGFCRRRLGACEGTGEVPVKSFFTREIVCIGRRDRLVRLLHLNHEGVTPHSLVGREQRRPAHLALVALWRRQSYPIAAGRRLPR